MAIRANVAFHRSRPKNAAIAASLRLYDVQDEWEGCPAVRRRVGESRTEVSTSRRHDASPETVFQIVYDQRYLSAALRACETEPSSIERRVTRRFEVLHRNSTRATTFSCSSLSNPASARSIATTTSFYRRRSSSVRVRTGRLRRARWARLSRTTVSVVSTSTCSCVGLAKLMGEQRRSLTTANSHSRVGKDVCDQTRSVSHLISHVDEF